jgi:RNA polymerase sigma-70 factor (ECF subfamily)
MALSTSATLLTRARDPRDEASWATFCARYRPIVVACARGAGMGAWEAEDVAQMVLLDLLRSLRSFRYDPQRGRFRDYLWVLVRHRVRRHHARSREELLEQRALEAVSDGRTPALERLWRTEWVRHHLDLAFASLRRDFEPRSLEVFEHLLAGNDEPATAERFGLSVAAVEKVKQRVRARMREILRTLDEEDVLDGLA